MQTNGKWQIWIISIKSKGLVIDEFEKWMFVVLCKTGYRFIRAFEAKLPTKLMLINHK